MHIASKVTLVLGAIFLVIGGLGLVGGIGSVADAGAESETYLTTVTDGTFTPEVNESWTISVYVIHPTDCETLELSITDTEGNDIAGECEIWTDMDMQEGQEVLYGDIWHTPGMTYTVESNAEVTIRGEYCDEACVDAVIGGIFGALGGFGAICCAIPLLVLGLILAFVLDDPPQNVMMPVGQMQPGQVAYQAPVQSQMPMGQTVQSGYGQPMQQITPPLTQQPQQAQPAQITPPISEQPSQNPWENL